MKMKKPSKTPSTSTSSSSSSRKSNFQNRDSTQSEPIQIPIDSPRHKPQSESQSQTESSSSSSAAAAAATKIQSTYRAHLIRTLTKTIRTVNHETDSLQRTIQLQETVDLIRTNEIERLRLNESLMRLLLKLDSVRGFDPAVREARKSVSRRIVGLQEVVDAVAVEDYGEFVRRWDEDLEKIEGEVCRERGGGEMERFCAEKLGFVCFQRFLRGA